MVEGPVDLYSWTAREWTGGRAVGVGITEETGCGENRSGEAARGNDVVVLRGLICSDEDRHALAEVDVERRVANLESVSSFHLHHLHLVALDSEVERTLQSHVAYSKSVCFS